MHATYEHYLVGVGEVVQHQYDSCMGAFQQFLLAFLKSFVTPTHYTNSTGMDVMNLVRRNGMGVGRGGGGILDCMH
jgi:hypothetical protein